MKTKPASSSATPLQLITGHVPFEQMALDTTAAKHLLPPGARGASTMMSPLSFLDCAKMTKWMLKPNNFKKFYYGCSWVKITHFLTLTELWNRWKCSLESIKELNMYLTHEQYEPINKCRPLNDSFDNNGQGIPPIFWSECMWNSVHVFEGWPTNVHKKTAKINLIAKCGDLKTSLCICEGKSGINGLYRRVMHCLLKP